MGLGADVQAGGTVIALVYLATVIACAAILWVFDAPFELQRWGKKAAGRLLDGLMHDAFPVARVEQEQ